MVVVRIARAFAYMIGGKINTRGPVRVPPINDITMSNLGTDSPKAIPSATTDVLTIHRFHEKALIQNIIIFFQYFHVLLIII